VDGGIASSGVAACRASTWRVHVCGKKVGLLVRDGGPAFSIGAEQLCVSMIEALSCVRAAVCTTTGPWI